MQKKYVVRLTDQERRELQVVIKKLKGTSQKVRRAQILLKADADGPNWSDQLIAEAFSCRTRTVEKIRQRLVERGFDETLNGADRPQPPVAKLLNGEQEARIIAATSDNPKRTRASFSSCTGCSSMLSCAWLFPLTPVIELSVMSEPAIGCMQKFSRPVRYSWSIRRIEFRRRDTSR